MKVKLFTADGGFVHEQTIPWFKAPPDIVIWGERFFSRADTSEAERDGTIAHRYAEGFTYALVPAEG